MRNIAPICVAVAALFLATSANAVVNGGFETGTMGGWTTSGAASAKTSAIGVTPTAGTFQGYLESTGNFTATAPIVVSTLGFPGPAILAFGAGVPVNGTGITQSLTVSAGDVLSFDWNFASDELNEAVSYNDFAFFTIDANAYMLASRNSSTFTLVSPPPGFDGQTGWSTQTYTFASAGTYTLGFGVFNVGDAGHNSVLILDQISIPVPEPVSVGGIFAVAAMLRRRRYVQACRARRVPRGNVLVNPRHRP